MEMNSAALSCVPYGDRSIGPYCNIPRRCDDDGHRNRPRPLKRHEAKS